VKPSDAGPASSKDDKPDRLEEAMKEAVQAVEKREREARGEPEDDGVELEVESSESTAPKKKGASEAVTEALIKAKEELERVLEQTREETKHFREKHLRAAADLENYKKRAAREREEVVKFANERLLKDLLVVIDDLDRTLQVGLQAHNEAAASILDGVQMVAKKFVAQLEKHGVTTFESIGKPFDPAVHEAVTQVHSDAVPLGGVVNELRRGFTIAGRLLRPAMVTVSLGAEAPKTEEHARASGEPREDSGE